VPERDLLSRAAFVGLVDGHGRGHLLRAALESLGYWLRGSLDVLEEATSTAFQELLVIGGATRSKLWLQIKADCTGCRLVVPELEEAVAVGAALLAGVGAGCYSDAEAGARALQLGTRRIEPDAEAVRQYARARAVYRMLYPSLRDVNGALRALGQGPDALTIL
jgi:xylulokinase